MLVSSLLLLLLYARSRGLGNNSGVRVRMVNVLLLLYNYVSYHYTRRVRVCAFVIERELGRHQDIFLVHFTPRLVVRAVCVACRCP